MSEPCQNCWADMVWADDHWECPKCGFEMWEDDDDDIPVGCTACGGDYPNCKDSCPIFDN